MDARIAIQRIGPLGVLGVASVSVVAAKLYAQMLRVPPRILFTGRAGQCGRNHPILRIHRFLIIRDPVLRLGCINQCYWKLRGCLCFFLAVTSYKVALFAAQERFAWQ